MSDDPFRDALLRVTNPSAAEAERLAAAVTRHVDALREVDALAARIGEPSPQAVRRLHARLDVRPAPRRRALALGGLLAAATAATAAALALWPDADPMEHVKLTLDGSGHVEQSGPQPVVVWDDGRVDVEVEPDAGVHLAVRTPEATVTVVGTGFTVERAHFATVVDVRHGVVSVVCADGSDHRLGAGEDLTCLPTDPAALLRRAVSLGPMGDRDQRRQAIDAGLVAANPEIRGELLARLVELLAGDDKPGAVAAAAAYVESGALPRRRAMLEFVATHRYAREGCAAADALRAAVDDHPATSLAVPLAGCVADDRPAEARALLGAVSDPGPWAALAATLRERLR
jgi:hypothetical protein